MYSFFTTSAEVKRKGAYVNNKSTWTLTWGSYMGYFKQASINDLIDRENFWKEYHFTTNYDADIQDGDILVINGKNYNVKAVANKKALQEIQYTICTLMYD